MQLRDKDLLFGLLENECDIWTEITTLADDLVIFARNRAIKKPFANPNPQAVMYAVASLVYKHYFKQYLDSMNAHVRLRGGMVNINLVRELCEISPPEPMPNFASKKTKAASKPKGAAKTKPAAKTAAKTAAKPAAKTAAKTAAKPKTVVKPKLAGVLRGGSFKPAVKAAKLKLAPAACAEASAAGTAGAAGAAGGSSSAAPAPVGSRQKQAARMPLMPFAQVRAMLESGFALDAGREFKRAKAADASP